MHAQGSPAIPLDARIHIVDFTPFAHCDRLAILAGHTGQPTMLIYFATICTAVGSIGIAIRQLSGIQRHLGSIGGSYQGHHDRRPGERSPTAMHGRLSEVRAELFNMSPTRYATENRSEV